MCMQRYHSVKEQSYLRMCVEYLLEEPQSW